MGAARQRLNEQPASGKMEAAGRNAALFRLGCQLRRQGKSDDEVAAAIRDENREGNVELHEKFAEGALEEREVATIIGSVAKQPKGESEEDLLERLNAEYCVVQDGGKVRVLRFDPQIEMKMARSYTRA